MGEQPSTRDTDAVRETFLEFQRERGHVILPRASLVPHDDPTTLFTGSGMQPLLRYLEGAEHPDGPRLADSQPCLRSQDLDEVGDDRHTTFFEMLGNWSLGDYGKEEQLRSVWELLVVRLGLDPSRLYVSCFGGDDTYDLPRDDESAAVWKDLFAAAGIEGTVADLGTLERAGEIGSDGARICFYGRKNWWCRGDSMERMPLGDPGGTDSEMFYLFPSLAHNPAYGARCHPNCDCGRYVEIGNSDFMSYQRTEDGFAPLPRHNVDFGGGLERIAAAVIDSPDVFRTSLLWPLVQRLEERSGVGYDDATAAFRVVADHVRGATFLAVDGVVPSNKAQGYVLRRLVRRAMRKAHELGLDEDFVGGLVPTVAGLYRDAYPEVEQRRDEVVATLAAEERKFRRTLERGLAHVRSYEGRTVTGADLFAWKDTYGFPVELSLEEVRAESLALDPDWQHQLDDLVREQRERSRAATKKEHL
ncbi:alanine--tRNA ligase-related protein [Mumia quercus]|uniref:alanine--tRNA ligase-related protein n=1 Tax=Mumia quercus TaxID=2976125 RepID=UPI0021D184FE|nr:alanine--tRNA ligase-related protein [Mumia quercus]